ncbi:MAG: hypothetical protein ACPGFA_01210 [Pikeienuella sp.]
MTNTADDYRACAAKGMTQTETAHQLGVDPSAVSYMARKYEIAFKGSKQGSALKMRRAVWSCSPAAIARWEATQ